MLFFQKGQSFRKSLLSLFILFSFLVFGQNGSNLVSTFSKSNKKDQSIAIASWNTRKLGRSKSGETIQKMARLLRDFDMIALQEVVAKDPAGAQKVAELAAALNRLGSKWDYQVSDPTQSSSPNIRERYAFLWKTANVQQVRRAHLDQELHVVIDREPFIGEFKAKKSNKNFFVINFHARPTSNQPEAEIVYLKNYQKRLGTNKFIIMGDFNLNEKNPVWNSFYNGGGKSALKNSRTTLKRKCKDGRYLSSDYDNFYFESGIKKQRSGRIDIVRSCQNLPLSQSLSDHLPIFMEFTVN